LAYRRKNIYLEPSLYFALPGSEIFIEAAKGILQDQVIYASAFPFAPLDIKEEFIKTYDLSGAVLDKILGGNAASFLGL
jgi:predicted TIM-barrel fold metal-dependent hydrolase